MTRGLVDTSVFVAHESRGLDRAALPDESIVSVVTHAELTAGVLLAQDADARSRRLATLVAAAQLPLFPIDARVAERWAELRVRLAGERRRVNVNDVWIAATALANDVAVFTQDGDFGVLADVAGLEVVRV